MTGSPGTTGQVEIGQVPLYVSEKAGFEIAQVDPPAVRAGDSGVSVRITIKNAGTVEADSVRVQLRVGNYFSGTLTDFLGTMQPGETKTAFLTVDVDSKAQPQKYQMDVRLDWTQSDNSLDKTLTIGLDVVPAEIPMPLIAVGLVLIVLVAAVVLRRRRKSRSQA
jgi:LPXTG-motif cell wall-anchored protein